MAGESGAEQSCQDFAFGAGVVVRWRGVFCVGVWGACGFCAADAGAGAVGGAEDVVPHVGGRLDCAEAVAASVKASARIGSRMEGLYAEELASSF